MTSPYNETQSYGKESVYFLQLSADNMHFDNWWAPHPTAAEDADITDQLSKFTEARLPIDFDLPISGKMIVPKCSATQLP